CWAEASLRIAPSNPTCGSSEYFCRASARRVESAVVRKAASKLEALRPLATKYGPAWAAVSRDFLLTSSAYISVDWKPVVAVVWVVRGAAAGLRVAGVRCEPRAAANAATVLDTCK